MNLKKIEFKLDKSDSNSICFSLISECSIKQKRVCGLIFSEFISKVFDNYFDETNLYIILKSGSKNTIKSWNEKQKNNSIIIKELNLEIFTTLNIQ